MGLLNRLTKPKETSRASGSYAPPLGPPPPSTAYQQPAQYAPPPQQYQYQQPPQQQYYAPPSAPPPATYALPFTNREDALAALAKYDTAFLIDDSESMEMFWDDLSTALQSVIQRSVQYDTDGVDISFFNNRTKATSKSADDLFRLFRSVEPRRSTPTASALRRVLEPYISDLENWNIEGKPGGYPRPKPLNLIVLTDGAPDRNEDPEPVIVDVAQRLDKIRMPPYQLGIQFVQIGVDEEASEHLRRLDDDLKSQHSIRDMVDTTLFDPEKSTLNEQYILKALLGSMNRSIDKQQL